VRHGFASERVTLEKHMGVVLCTRINNARGPPQTLERGMALIIPSHSSSEPFFSNSPGARGLNTVSLCVALSSPASDQERREGV